MLHACNRIIGTLLALLISISQAAGAFALPCAEMAPRGDAGGHALSQVPAMVAEHSAHGSMPMPMSSGEMPELPEITMAPGDCCDHDDCDTGGCVTTSAALLGRLLSPALISPISPTALYAEALLMTESAELFRPPIFR